MTIGTDGIFWVEMPGLSQEQVRRALAAAHRSLAASGFSIEDAYDGWCKPELIQFDPKRRMSKRDRAAFDAWFAALKAARIAAGCADNSAEATLQLLPAEIGQSRYDNAVADLQSGRALEVIPPPDPGPHFRFASQAA